jgi:hypothetical protein
MPLEAVSPDDPPLPKPKLPKPEPKAPDVFAIPAHHRQQCCHCINATRVNGTLSLTTQAHMHRHLAVQSRRAMHNAGCKNRHDCWYTHKYITALAHNQVWHIVNRETPWRSSPVYFAWQPLAPTRGGHTYRAQALATHTEHDAAHATISICMFDNEGGQHT